MWITKLYTKCNINVCLLYFKNSIENPPEIRCAPKIYCFGYLHDKLILAFMNSRKWAFSRRTMWKGTSQVRGYELAARIGSAICNHQQQDKPLQDSGLQKNWYVLATSPIWGGYFCSYLMNYWDYYRSMVLSRIHIRRRRIISSLTMIKHTALPAEVIEQLQAAFQAWCFFADPWFLNLVTCTYSLLQVMMLAHPTTVNYKNQNKPCQ